MLRLLQLLLVLQLKVAVVLLLQQQRRRLVRLVLPLLILMLRIMLWRQLIRTVWIVVLLLMPMHQGHHCRNWGNPSAGKGWL